MPIVSIATMSATLVKITIAGCETAIGVRLSASIAKISGTRVANTFATCSVIDTAGSGIRTVVGIIARTRRGITATAISIAGTNVSRLVNHCRALRESGFFILRFAYRILPMRAIEICVDSPEGVIAARDGRADRVELCDNLFEGGTTPSIGAIKLARRVGGIKLHVIIRPRGGDFLYTDVEFETMKFDIEAARTARVDGIVIGLLTADGNIDKERTRELLILAQPMSVTFHRAFDVCRDPLAALEDLIDVGVDRVLTSGQQADAISGAETIKKLVDTAGDRIVVMACGGIDETNIADVVAATGAQELHFTAFEDQASEMEYRNENVAMGSDDAPSEYLRRVTSAEKVRATVEAASNS